MDRKSFLHTSVMLSTGSFLVPMSTTGQDRSTYTKTVNLKEYGAKGDGKTDDTEVIQKAIDTLETGDRLEIPIGTYLIYKTLFVRDLQNVIITGMGPGSKLVAMFEMNDLLHITYSFSGSIIQALTLDANGFANNALRVMGGGYVRLNGLNVLSPRNIGIWAGPENPDDPCGPEFLLTNSRITGMVQSKASDPSSKIGVLVEEAWTDSHYDNLIIRGFTECAMELRANSNLISKVHVYRYPAFQYYKGLSLKGNENYLVQAYFDNAINVGCEILGDNTTIFSSYVLRIKLAFNSGPVAPGVGIQIGSRNVKVLNVNIINNSFVNHVPNTPEYAANKLTGIELINGENIIAYDNQYDRAESGETRTKGTIKIPTGQKSVKVPMHSLVTPTHIQLTPISKCATAYWVSDLAKKNFTLNLQKPQKEAVSFSFATTE